MTAKGILSLSPTALRVHPRNTEFFDNIEGDKFEQFKNSIREDGIITPIVVAPDMTIISGHQRYQAACELDINEIPVIIDETLTDHNEKLKKLLAANFGREKNDESKQRKVIAEYVELCGYKNGGDRKAQAQNGLVVSQSDIAKQLGISLTDLKRALSIERNLTEGMKDLLDTGAITKTVAADVISSLSEEEQDELVSQLDAAKRYTQKEVKQLADEVKSLRADKSELEDKIAAQSDATSAIYRLVADISQLINNTDGIGDTKRETKEVFIKALDDLDNWVQELRAAINADADTGTPQEPDKDAKTKTNPLNEIDDLFDIEYVRKEKSVDRAIKEIPAAAVPEYLKNMTNDEVDKMWED